MRKIGLTGGIASGKSTVAAMLCELGFDVIFADEISRGLLGPGEAALHETVREFGPDILRPDGTLDRKKLASIVFADQAKLDRLNAIIHPRVEVEMLRRFAELEPEGRSVAFVEAALLVEAGYMKNLDGLVVTWCKPEQQMERLVARGMTEKDARARIAAQMPVEEKLKLATYKIDCSQSMEETQRQVQELAKTLRD
jgi:dephospho-CoA kinase